MRQLRTSDGSGAGGDKITDSDVSGQRHDYRWMTGGYDAEGKWREVGYYCAVCGQRREADVIPMKEKP